MCFQSFFNSYPSLKNKIDRKHVQPEVRDQDDHPSHEVQIAGEGGTEFSGLQSEFQAHPLYQPSLKYGQVKV
jgi:hypothetical protein